MKKMLLINNYDMSNSRKAYLAGKSSSQHQFGTNELIDLGRFEVDYMLVGPKEYKSKIMKLISLVPAWIRSYRKAKKYDCVYGAADFTVDFLAFMKKIGLFKPQLISIFHHPPFPLRLKIGKYDKILFLSEYAHKEMGECFPKLTPSMEFMQWGPDLSFYRKIAATPNYMLKNDDLIFISNGKTHRDHDLLVLAAEISKNKTTIVSDERSIPSNYNEQSLYTHIYYQNSPDDSKMIELLQTCSVLVVPTYPSKHTLGPIGLTSFLDAIALGMPIITASNTVLADTVLNNKLGFVYKAGDVNDLCDKMNLFKNNKSLLEEYGKNAYIFGQKNDIKAFSSKLINILDGIEKRPSTSEASVCEF